MDDQALALDSATRQLNTIRFLAEAEMQKYADMMTEFEKRIETLELLTSAELLELEKRVEELELESYELNKRVEKLEQAQRSVTEVVIRI